MDNRFNQIAITGCVFFLCLHQCPLKLVAQPRLSRVVTSSVIQREIAAGDSYVGIIEPLKRAVLGSAVDGRVVEFTVNEGDRVTTGQPVGKLLTATIQLELQAAKAELELRQQELAELLNGARPEEIDQARARMQSAEAFLSYAKSKYARWESLFEQSGAVTRDQLEEALAERRSAQEKYFENKASYALVMAGPRQEKIAQAKARLAAQKAIVDKLTDQIQKHTIVSRFPGYVVREFTEIGAWVSRGDPVAEVIALDEIDVLVAVLAKDVFHIHIGMEVRVVIPALAGHVFVGRVALVVPQADERARTFPVKIRVKNTIRPDGPLLKAGMLTRVALPTGLQQKAFLISKDALVLGGEHPIIYLFDPDPTDPKHGKARRIEVSLGVADDGLIQVHGDLKEGQRVIVQGNERLRPQQEVFVSRHIAVPDTTPDEKQKPNDN